jgi:hypothetical protein
VSGYQAPPAPKLDAVFCGRCGGVLGYTDGPTLYLAACSLRQKVTLHCQRQLCEGFKVWHPGPKGER